MNTKLKICGWWFEGDRDHHCKLSAFYAVGHALTRMKHHEHTEKVSHFSCFAEGV